MSNFTVAIVSIVYGVVCLTQESEQGMNSRSTSIENFSRKVAGGEIKAITPAEPKKLKLD